MSTFGGIVSEIPNISIDRFDGENLMSTAYFLSHCHSDHMVGLQERAFINHLETREDIFLYCSEISYQILMNTNLERVSHKLKTMSVLGPYIVNVPASARYPEDQQITISAVPAGHCPGSFMFLLESCTGTILYTGDIRIAEGDIKKLKQLQKEDGEVKRIQTLYLDTTFLDPKYNYFPTRRESGLLLSCMIREWTDQSPRHHACIVTAAKHGSEYLFIEIFKTLKMKVHVNDDHFNLYQRVAEVECAITNDPTETRIHACNYNFKGTTYLQCMNSSDYNLRHIKPSAMWFQCRYKDEKKICAFSNISRVAYSCHSSFSELADIVKYLNPSRIVPCVVPKNSSRGKMERLLSTLQSDSMIFKQKVEPNFTHTTQTLEFKSLMRKSRTWGRDADKRAARSKHIDLPSPPRMKLSSRNE